MTTPYKGLGVPKPAAAPQQTQRVPQNIPMRRDASINESSVDKVPGHSPPLAWPAAPGTTTNPIKK